MNVRDINALNMYIKEYIKLITIKIRINIDANVSVHKYKNSKYKSNNNGHFFVMIKITSKWIVQNTFGNIMLQVTIPLKNNLLENINLKQILHIRNKLKVLER